VRFYAPFFKILIKKVIMQGKLFVIGLGHRARHGKDIVADFIKTKRKNVIVYHFADPLKEEIMNKSRLLPLIYRQKSKFSNHYWYNVWSHDEEYRSISEENLPFLHKIFEDRKIEEYWGMNGNGHDEHKDSLMLQFWGTNWRRQKYADDYWIRRVEDYYIKNCFSKQFDGNVYFLLPDTRFRNEVEWIKNMQNSENNVESYYVKIVRYNFDGTPYYDPNRDPNHQSEIDLENITPDYLMAAKSGEINYLEGQTDHFLHNLENVYK
jgi:hypothetical protein